MSNLSEEEAIVLIGFMGSGKTTVGRELARRLQIPFVDLDSVIIEQAGMTIPEIFAREGEEGFRHRETQALESLYAVEGSVVATGGGVVTVEEIDDVGVAGIARLFDNLESIRAADVLVVAAGREGALPTVLAGLVDVPLIGLPVSAGYGHGGRGEAALAGMLQSCAPILVVNIDAGFVAGAQASLIARSVSEARSE